MTDTRYQRDINALVRQKRRSRLSPPAPRSPVPGGRGYGGASVKQPLALDQIFFGWDQGVSRCGEPPIATPVEVIFSGQRCANTTVTAGDIYSAVTGGSGDEQEIERNGLPFLSGFFNIDSLSSNTTELFVHDADNGNRIQVFNRQSGSLIRELTGGTPWQTNDSPIHSLRANDTHFAFVIRVGAVPADQGLWIYQNDFTFITQVPNPGDEDLPSVDVTADRIYKWARLADGTARLAIYDLTGTLVDSQIFTAEPLWPLTFEMYICVTFGGLWVWSYPGIPNPGRIWYYPRTVGELFDQALVETVETVAPINPSWPFLGLWDGSRDRDYTLEEA